ncbi:MAG: amidohydrolase [Candidatus Geothermincolia bacterium]
MSSWNSPASFLRPRFGRDSSTPADMVVLSAKVLACDEQGTRAQAVAIKEGKFVYVGDNAGAKEFIGPDTKVINARRRMLVPGFIDAHVHILWVGLLRSFLVDLYACKSMDNVRDTVLDFAKANPDLPFIFGIGWMYDYVPDNMPDPAMLDAILADRPVFLWSYEATTGWANTKMAKLMFERNPAACKHLVPEVVDGKPTGMFMHAHSFDPFEFFSMEEFGPDIKERMFETLGSAISDMVKAGVTAFDELQVYKSLIPLILEYRDRGGLDDVRVRGTYYVDPVDSEDEKKLIEDLEAWKALGEKESSPSFKLGESLKLYIDGCFGNHTSFFLEPYADAPGNCGEACWTQDGFDRLMEIADSLHLQTCTHSIGDAGIRRVVNSCEHSLAVNGPWDARHRVDHCEFPTREDIARMAKLGIYASMQPIHFFGDDSNERVVGHERLQGFDPWLTIENAGVEIGFGTDYIAGSYIPPVNPIYGLLIAGTRINYKLEADWAPEEKITMENAIQHYTLGSAKCMKMEDRIGSIEVGKMADFTMWHTDLLKINSWYFLLTNEVEVGKLDGFLDMTVVDGRVVYERGA